MFKYATAALLAGTILLPAAAYAQDRAPFTGPRVEAMTGYDNFRSGEQDDGDNTSEDEGDESIDSIAYGAAVGFDFNAGNLVLGVEGEYSDSAAEQDFNETIDGTEFLGQIGIGRDIYVGGRVGFTAAPRTLIYAKGGYTNTAIESAFTSGGDRIDFDTTVDGWRLGAGVEQMLGQNAYVKAEYRYSNYNGLQFDDDLFGDEDIDIDLDRHQVIAGVGFRF